MSESSNGYPTVLLPEVDEEIAKFQAAIEAGGSEYTPDSLHANVLFEEMTLEEAAKRLTDGYVDVVIAGASHSSSDVLRTVIHHVNRVVAPDKRSTITSFFMMEKEGETTLFFTDCAVIPMPDSEQLIAIAENTCESVRQLGIEPVVAFLSFSTLGSSTHERAVEISRTAAEFKKRHPEIISYGEIQADAALDPRIFAKKAAGAGIELVDGKMPNVFVFPSLESGNTAYKLVEQLAGYVAVGPMLGGTEFPIHDLSRGVNVKSLAANVRLSADLAMGRSKKSE